MSNNSIEHPIFESLQEEHPGRVLSSNPGLKHMPDLMGPGAKAAFDKLKPDPPGVNPKDAFGKTKPDMFLVPPAAKLYIALAMKDGAEKYGTYNWRENKVLASVYLAAAMRHIDVWLDGEELTPDSKVPHLGAAMACLGILADAQEMGNLADDRPRPARAPDMLDDWAKMSKRSQSIT